MHSQSFYCRFHQSYIGNQKWLEESVHEAEVRIYYVRYPTLQRFASRKLKLSSLHSRLEEAGAFFGATGGHERPLFFLAGWFQRLRKKAEKGQNQICFPSFLLSFYNRKQLRIVFVPAFFAAFNRPLTKAART